MLDVDLETVESIGDWIELSLLVSPSGHITLDRLFKLAEEELGVEAARTSLAVGILESRSTVLGDLYPFVVRPDIAVLRRRDARLIHSYTALLLLTPKSISRQLLSPQNIGAMGELFEEIAERALAKLWGVGGSAIRFAFPSRYGRPEQFDQAIDWLAKRIGVKPGHGYRPPRRKDGGVDVVAWRQFRDRRAGFPIALAQCTIQGEKYTKTTDIDTRLWSTWLRMDNDPLSLLVIPGTIPRAGTQWDQLTSVVTVIERLRLIELLGRAERTDEPIEWATMALESLRERLGAAEI
ncbi:hypothetical protein [Microbacterium sp. Bi121]|uniref:hypothetical protein n=1 Tax=Microbacterium sp. Bi121 TaxID=2822348 RepID=UPI001E41FEBD|nr:hypothetical protein [Microbacterium sp. Bi121]